MMSSIGAFWDANETWLIVAGGILFGAFPLAYGVLLNALYIPVMIMLFGLIFRAVSFEFHSHSLGKSKTLWQFAFGTGSLVAVMGQGLSLGGLLGGVRVLDDEFVGGPGDWLSGTSVVVAIVIALAYMVLGATYLRGKNPRQGQKHSWRPFAASLAILGVIFAGLLVTICPYIVPKSITIPQAAASTGTLTIMLFGVGLLIPIMLGYNYYMYRVFRGKTGDIY
jgi:cytochrome d ubiquinol oxidase subunit II